MENVVISSRKKVTMEKVVSQTKVSAEENIKKVLGVFAEAVPETSEFSNGLLTVSGKQKVTVIYLTDDGRAERAEQISDFVEKQQQSFVLEDAFSVASVEVSNYTLAGNDVLCFLETEISVHGNYKYEIPMFSDEENNLCLNKKSFNAPKLVCMAEDNFVVAEETECNLTGVKVLHVTASVLLGEVSVLVDKVVLEGKVLANVVYSDETGVSNLSKEYEFKQEISANGALPSNNCDAFISVKNVTVTPEETDGKTNFVFVFDLFSKSFVYDENTYEIATDLFSLSNELSTSYSYLEMKNFAGFKNYSDTVLLSADVTSLENFDDIVGVFEPKFVPESIEKQNGKYILSGKVNMLAIYKSESDVHSFIHSGETKLEISGEQEAELRDYSVCAAISSFKVKAGKELEIMLSLNYTANFETALSERYVKGYEVKAEKDAGKSGIKVYIASAGETVFDVARNLNVRPEIIIGQNEVAGSFEQGEKIYVYSPVNLA